MLDAKARKAYRELIQPRYQRAKKKVKAKVLDEFCAVCGYNRKYAIQLLQKPFRYRKTKKKPGPKSSYHEKGLVKALMRIWLESDQACSKRLKVIIPLWLPYYEKHYGELSETYKEKLLTISAATIDRLLKPIRDLLVLKKRKSPAPGTLLKHQIPLKKDVLWDTTRPGFVEADTVAHCGNSMRGDYAWSLTFTDINTTWTEIRAVWNKGATAVVQQIKDIEEHLPFLILGFNSDNGTEFLNVYLITYFQNKSSPVTFSRSRPFIKNDNAHVEQKNWTHVRHLFGYIRLKQPGVVALMNDLYANEWRLYQNFFMPTMKLIYKNRIGARYQKRYDKPMTPYQRVLASPYVTEEQKQKLILEYQNLDPFLLRKTIERKVKNILKIN